jgi:hypothetical protein
MRTDHKQLALTFERIAARNLALGFEKETAERMAMRMALRAFGWTAHEADQMTHTIFADASKELPQ